MNEAASCEYLRLTFQAWQSGAITPEEVFRRFSSLEEFADASEALSPDDYSIQEVKPEPGSDGPAVLQLVVRDEGELQVWQFRPGDPDPFPSVPHGHHQKRAGRKLDVYHGAVYQNSSFEKQIPREAIIRLWNDDGFREMARKALDHFIAANPSYQFDHPNPRKLPRKRLQRRRAV